MSTPPNDVYAPEDPLNPDPFAAYPSPAPRTVPALPVAQPRKSRRVVPIVLGLATVGVLLGAMTFWVARTQYVKFSSALTSNTSVPAPFAEAGDCALVTGSRDAPSYAKVTCADNRHNYTVGKVSPNTGEKCGEDEYAYIKYHVKYNNGEHTVACLIPAFVDGQCYDYTPDRQRTELPLVACGGPEAAKVRVLANTVDKAACGPDAGLALVYPEIKTTYCLMFRH